MLYINIKKFKTAHKKGHLYKLLRFKAKQWLSAGCVYAERAELKSL